MLVLCGYRFRLRSRLSYVLIILCCGVFPLYFLSRPLAKANTEDVPHFIRHQYLAKSKGTNETSDKLDDHAEVIHLHSVKHDKNFDKYYLQASDPRPDLFRQWDHTSSAQCDGHFTGFGNLGAMLHDVILDMSKCRGPKGGEDFQKLMNQREDVEYLKYSRGFFTLPCDSGQPSYKFTSGKKTHLDIWMDNLVAGKVDQADQVINDFTIAITRYEYVNMYHTMTDYYNAFLVMAYFNKTQHQTNILILDAHPSGGLDSVWGTVFNSMTRISQLAPKTRFTNLAFGVLGYASPLYVSYKNPSTGLPLSEEYREFLLSSYNLPTEHPLDCDKLHVLFIWRRDYIAHPRNPKGTVFRKIKNENELVDGVKRKYPGFTVKGIQMDRFEMANQVKFVSEADILIGMHGAALSHMLFMPKGRGIIELMPNYVTPAWRGHFIKMAKENGLFYERWVNKDRKLEHPGYFTTIPSDILNDQIAKVMQKMCQHAS